MGIEGRVVGGKTADGGALNAQWFSFIIQQDLLHSYSHSFVITYLPARTHTHTHTLNSSRIGTCISQRICYT